MDRIAHKIQIPLPPSEVFKVIATPEHLAELMPGIDGIAHIGPETEPFAVPTEGAPTRAGHGSKAAKDSGTMAGKTKAKRVKAHSKVHGPPPPGPRPPGRTSKEMLGLELDLQVHGGATLHARIIEHVPNRSCALEDAKGTRSRWVCVPTPGGTLLANEILGNFGPDRAARVESEAMDRLQSFVDHYLEARKKPQ